MAVLLMVNVGLSHPASAETVLLTRGGSEHGLGWLFRHSDGSCRIATPKHVIQRDDGTLIPPDMLDRFGHHHATFDPAAAPDQERDLAFLRVGGSLADEGCSTSRLSSVSLTAAVARLNTAFLSVATPFDRQTIQVEQKATVRDEGGGTVIAIAPAAGAEPLRKGMSGGAVMFENRPIAMLTDVDADLGVGIALRFDVIAAQLALYLNAAPLGVSQTNAKSGIGNVSLIAGRVAQTDGGLSAFKAGLGDLTLQPADGRITLVLDLGELRAVTRVSVEGSPSENAPQVMIVEASSQSSGFMPANRCTLASDAAWQCSFAARRADRLRITFPTDAAQISIARIETR